jgi:TPR repeat protein
MAAAQDDPEATSNLGSMYLQGRSVKRDLMQAFQLFRKAAERGYAVAQNNLALMYANGQAVARDYVWAYAWMDLAANELPASAQLRERIAKEMTAEQIAQAGERAASKRVELARKGETSK